MNKILFINAIKSNDYIQEYLSPLGLGYLASVLRLHFRDVQVRIIDREVEKILHEWQPDIVGITAVSENWDIACQYARAAKLLNKVVIVGGMHVSALPETMTADMDIAVIGEGENTIVELVERIKNNEFGGIPGIAFWQQYHGKKIIVSNPPRDVIPSLDSLPLPDRSLFQSGDRQHMFTARGCPYRCIFCASSRYWSKLRYFSPAYVVNEMRELVGVHHARHIEIWDDLFIADKARLAEIVRLLEHTDIPTLADFSCQARANLLDEATVKLLKRMNVQTVGMGFESGCPKTLEYLKGHSVTIEDNLRAVKLLHDNGIKSAGGFIIGSPLETKSDILQTLEFIRHSPISSFDVHLLTPFPGTPVWDYAKSRGLVSNDMDFSRLGMAHGDNWEKAIILSEVLSREELYELYRLFLREKTRRKFKRVLRNPLLGLKYSGQVLDCAKRVLKGKPPFSY